MGVIMSLVPVVLSGGAGSRLWPASRKLHPKPFMSLPDGGTLMGRTFQRASALPGVEKVLTVTNRDLYFHTRDEFDRLQGEGRLPELLKQGYLLEPIGRNTAPAIAAAALHIQAQYGDDTCLLVMPADHLMLDETAFAQAVQAAQALAAKDYLVTFGIQPDQPETGFGYIQAAKEFDMNSFPQSDFVQGYPVNRFVEKPDLETAQAYVSSGEYFWNAGIFCFTAGYVLSELERHAPELLASVRKTLAASEVTSGKLLEQLELDLDTFRAVEDISIDYALLEKSDRVAVVPGDFGWSDIGSWSAFSELLPQDQQGNRVFGDVIALDSRNTTIHSPCALTATVGVDDLIIVNTDDALLVAHKDSAQDVKKIVSELSRSGHDAHLVHKTVHRPWGTYTTLEEDERFKIKRIVVKPGQRLSLQMHHHRSEHWVVVSGMARVEHNGREFFLNTNESTFIPAGHQHRLENPGVIDLVLIEVQSGDYLGEDDIVRLDDVYGRVVGQEC